MASTRSPLLTVSRQSPAAAPCTFCADPSEPANFLTTTTSTEVSAKGQKEVFTGSVYECYNPRTQSEARALISRLLHRKRTSPLTAAKGSSEFSVLSFDSAFECGNLREAVYKSEVEYDLYLNSDTNSADRCQWFYFGVGNTQRNATVKFNVRNMTKFPHCIKDGMKPLALSVMDKEGWRRIAEIQVARSDSLLTEGNRSVAIDGVEEVLHSNSKRVYYYTLSFSYTFKHSNDKVYFALWRPYSYSDLMRFIGSCEAKLLESSAKSFTPALNTVIETGSIHYEREQLCTSLGGVPVHLITVTAPEAESRPNKKCIVITARMHAAETVGSFKAEGILKHLLGSSSLVSKLRREFTFLLAPMMNPDGVILGNTRCSLGGWDLNRCWGSPEAELQPSVHRMKEKVRQMGAEAGLYFDLHGHSQALNSFIFACHTELPESPSSWAKTRLFPRIFSDKCHMVKCEQCQFKSELDKVLFANTSRWTRQEW